MVVIRLSRVGKKKQAFYRVVVADSRRPVTAKFIEILGWYNPHTKELNVKKEKIETWFSHGAKPSNSVAILFEKNKIALPSWVKIEKKSKKPKKEVEIAEPAKETPAPVEPPEEPQSLEQASDEVALDDKKQNNIDNTKVSADDK